MSSESKSKECKIKDRRKNILARLVPIWVWPVLFLFAFGTVWLRLTIVRISYQVDQNSRLLENARKEKEELELSVARLRSPNRLEALAKSRFSLQTPQTGQIIRMNQKSSHWKKGE